MSEDRERLNETDQDASLPIVDIDGSDVKAATAETVKGGFSATEHTNIRSQSADTSNIGSQSSGAGAGKVTFNP